MSIYRYGWTLPSLLENPSADRRHALLWQLTFDLCHAGSRADFVLVSAGRSPHADAGHDFIVDLDGSAAGQSGDIWGRCDRLSRQRGYFIRAARNWLVVVT